jgi:hypothetical protein
MKTYIMTHKFEATEEAMKALENHLKNNIFPYSRDIKHLDDGHTPYEIYEREACGFCAEDVIHQAKEGNDRIIDEKQANDIMDIMEKKYDASLGMDWDTISIWVDYYFEQNTIKVKYVNIDSWNRPIFKAVDNPFYYGSTETLCSHGESEEVVKTKVVEKDLCYFGNHFDCEPMGDPVKQGLLEIVWSE